MPWSVSGRRQKDLYLIERRGLQAGGTDGLGETARQGHQKRCGDCAGQTDSQWVADIGLLSGDGTKRGYPEVYTPFADHDCTVYTPLTEPLEPGRPTEFKVSLPGYSRAIVVVDGRRVSLVREPGSTVFDGTVTLPWHGEATVYANNGKGDLYDGILSYDIAK